MSESSVPAPSSRNAKNELHLYTVVGLVNGRWCIRVHEHVAAPDPRQALDSVRADLARRYEEASPGTTDFLAAAVFEGRIRCAHGGLINGPWGDDRSGPVSKSGPAQPLTVVAVDPASRALTVVRDHWPASGTAERDSRFDFWLIASTLKGAHVPCLTYSQPIEPANTTRNERIVAMMRYSLHYAQFIGSTAPMHMPC